MTANWTAFKTWLDSEATESWNEAQRAKVPELARAVHDLGYPGPPTVADAGDSLLSLTWRRKDNDGFIVAEINPTGAVEWWTWIDSRGLYAPRGPE